KKRARGVAGGEEPRDGRCHDNRIADEYIRLGLSYGGLRPGHRHQPHRSVEARQLEFGPRIAVGADRERAGEKGHEFLGGWRGLHLEPCPRIAARAHRAGRAVATVDKPSVDIADRDAELALAEVMALRVRGLERGQV